MALIVQKFGGSSVADSEKILNASRKAIRRHQQGHQVVVVVSAMGKTTNGLIALANQVSERPSAREMDMLLSTGEQVTVALMAMAIHSQGFKAVSLTGAQIGIKTDSTHTKARIKSISTDRMRKALNDGNIVIAAGFQGVDEDFNITTLGRGGSDTTAVALAAVLQADECEIYTDVDGVYSTDPRLIPEARRMTRISYDEMLELASLGAGVMHSRSIEFAKKFNVPTHVRSSFTDTAGTMIVAEAESVDLPVCGAALTRNEARVTVQGVPDVPGTLLDIFSRLAQRAVAVDMIVQNVGEKGKADVSFTVPVVELATALESAAESVAQLKAEAVTHDSNVAKVSVVGIGMAEQTGVAQKMFRALATAGINMQMITTSEIKISALVDKASDIPSLRAVHEVFALEKDPPSIQPITPASATTAAGGTPAGTNGNKQALDVIARLQGLGMEDLSIDGISLDQEQATITIRSVADKPGTAAAIFEGIAAKGIFVDMIVQSFGRQGQANISFTTPRQQAREAFSVTGHLAKELGCGEVTMMSEAAKLSVSGIGLRSHTGVAMRMFRSLTEAGINVEMVNTSEVQVNVIVANTHGQQALAAMQKAFADVLR